MHKIQFRSSFKAETLQALKLVEYNHSFSSVEEESKCFKMMFPDSKVAEKYQQSISKKKYTIQHGIAYYISDLFKTSITSNPFGFFFDETTPSQVKKQFDG